MLHFVLFLLLSCTVFMASVTEGMGVRGKSYFSDVKTGCSPLTRFNSLNCACRLTNTSRLTVPCKTGSNSWCINNKCSCIGKAVPDRATRTFCQTPVFTITVPALGLYCLDSLGLTDLSRNTFRIIFNNAALPVTCTYLKTSTTNLNLMVNRLNGTVTAEPNNLSSVTGIDYRITCTDSQGATSTGTSNIVYNGGEGDEGC